MMNNYIYDKQLNSDITDIKKAISILADVCNHRNSDFVGREIAVALSEQHRTLQASLVRSVADTMSLYQHSNHDLRNKGAIEWAAQVAKIETHIPFI